MSKHHDFIKTAKAHIDELGAELSALDVKLRQAGDKADAWTSDQAAKLKKDWEQAHAEMTSFAQRVESEGDEAIRDARASAERQWKALQDAVASYRDHVEKTVAS